MARPVEEARAAWVHRGARLVTGRALGDSLLPGGGVDAKLPAQIDFVAPTVVQERRTSMHLLVTPGVRSTLLNLAQFNATELAAAIARDALVPALHDALDNEMRCAMGGTCMGTSVTCVAGKPVDPKQIVDLLTDCGVGTHRIIVHTAYGAAVVATLDQFVFVLYVTTGVHYYYAIRVAS